MARPLRIEFPDAVYHVTSRGDAHEPVFRDDDDRLAFLRVLADTMGRFDAQVLAYCLLDSQYRLVLHTRRGNLSRLMRQLNGVYTQTFNRRHEAEGHLFQGRFKAVLVDRNTYLLPLCRDVERQAVAAGLAKAVGDWPWSSYRAHVCGAPTPGWLDTLGLHGHLLGRPVQTARDHATAARRYAAMVAQSASADTARLQDGLRRQIFLGDETFVQRMLTKAASHSARGGEAPTGRRRRVRTLAQWITDAGSRETGVWRAYRDGGMTMTSIAAEMGLSVSRISRLIASAEQTAPGT